MTTVEAGEAQRRRERVRELTRVWEQVSAERGLAMYQAARAGMTIADIAHAALTRPAEVEQVLASCRRDPDIDNLPDGPDWVEIWPRDRGWLRG